MFAAARSFSLKELNEALRDCVTIINAKAMKRLNKAAASSHPREGEKHYCSVLLPRLRETIDARYTDKTVELFDKANVQRATRSYAPHKHIAAAPSRQHPRTCLLQLSTRDRALCKIARVRVHAHKRCLADPHPLQRQASFGPHQRGRPATGPITRNDDGPVTLLRRPDR